MMNLGSMFRILLGHLVSITLPSPVTEASLEIECDLLWCSICNFSFLCSLLPDVLSLLYWLFSTSLYYPSWEHL